MKLRFLLVPLVCLLAGVASAADAQLLRLVMPDAKVVSGIDFDKVKTTPFGLFVLSQLPTGDSSFKEFVSATGFDPLLDISTVVAGDLASVRGAIDRRSSSPAMDIALADKISRVSANQDAWVFSI